MRVLLLKLSFFEHLKLSKKPLTHDHLYRHRSAHDEDDFPLQTLPECSWK